MKREPVRLLTMESGETRNFVIGGITGGIGSAIARRLSEAGQNVAGFARSQDRLVALADQHEGLRTTVCDATDADAVEEALADFGKDFGQIDGYVHAIGSIFLKPAHLTSPSDFFAVIEANLTTAFNALRAATKLMQRQGSGSLLFFSTAAARIGISNHEAVAAAKGGIEGLVRSAAATYASRGLRVNAIAPSLTDTPLSRPITGNGQALEFSKRMHPLGEIGRATDVASLAAWLLSEEATWVTGQIFVMDGGLSTIVPKPKA